MKTKIGLLNETKTYVLGVIGNSRISRFIRFLSTTNQKDFDEAYSHVAILYYDSGWHVIESRFKDKGVKRKCISLWFSENQNKRVMAVQVKLDIDKALELVHKNERYGTVDLFWHSFLSTFSKAFYGKRKLYYFNNKTGVTCAELVALCDRDDNFAFGSTKPAHEVIPFDYFLWAEMILERPNIEIDTDNTFPVPRQPPRVHPKPMAP